VPLTTINFISYVNKCYIFGRTQAFKYTILICKNKDVCSPINSAVPAKNLGLAPVLTKNDVRQQAKSRPLDVAA